MNNSQIETEISKLKTCVKDISESMFNIFYPWRKNTNPQNVTEDKAIAQCIFQMVMCKTHSIISLSEGISIIPNNENFKLIDANSIYSVLRSLYETIFIFRNIFIMPDTDEERRLLLNLWIIRGLYNRQKCDYTPNRFQEKQEKEQKDIQKLKDEIRHLATNLQMSEGAKKQVEHALNKETTMLKEYRFKKDANGIIVSMETISFEDSPSVLWENIKYKKLYTLMSLKSHPSYLGTLQFGQMYNDGFILNELKFVLESCCIFASIFISDFCRFADAQLYFEKLPEDSKNMIRGFSAIQ